MMTEICPIMFIDGTFYVNLPNKVVSGSEVSGSEVSVSGSEVSGCNLFQALTGSSALGIAGSEMMKLYSQEMDKKNAKKPLDTYKSDQDLSDEKVSTEIMTKTAFQSNVIHRPACNFGATSLFTSIKNLIIVLMCFAMVNPAAGGHVMDKGKVVDKDGAVYHKFPLLESNWYQNPEQSTDTCPNKDKFMEYKVTHCQYKFPAGEKVQCLESEVGIVSFCIPEDVSCEVQNQEAAPVGKMSGQVVDNLQPEAAAVKKMSELKALVSSQQVQVIQPVCKETKTECTQPVKLERSNLASQTQTDVKNTLLSSQVKQEPIVNNSTDKSGDHVKKEELPDIPPVTIFGDYSSKIREQGESTGRTITTGQICSLIVSQSSVYMAARILQTVMWLEMIIFADQGHAIKTELDAQKKRKLIGRSHINLTVAEGFSGSLRKREVWSSNPSKGGDNEAKVNKGKIDESDPLVPAIILGISVSLILKVYCFPDRCGNVTSEVDRVAGEEFASPHSKTLTQLDVNALAEYMKSVGALIYNGEVIGTVFRAGDDYLITAFHVIRRIIEPDNTSQANFSLIEAENVFVNFNYSVCETPEYKFRLRHVLSTNTLRLDYTVLQIINRNDALPKGLKLDKRSGNNQANKLHGIGYGSPETPFFKVLDNSCPIIPSINTRILESEKWLYDTNRGLPDQNVPPVAQNGANTGLTRVQYFKAHVREMGFGPYSVDRGYRDIDREQNIFLDSCLEHRGSGSPFLTSDGFVKGILTSGHPEFFYQLPKLVQAGFPSDKRFECTLKLDCVHQNILERDQVLANKLFG